MANTSLWELVLAAKTYDSQISTAMEERIISGSMLLTARSMYGEMPSIVALGRGTLTIRSLLWVSGWLVPMFILLVSTQIALDELTMSW